MKTRINICIDDEIYSWLRLAYRDGEKSQLVNGYLRFLMENNNPNPSKKERNNLIKQIDELQSQHTEMMKKITMLKSQLKKIDDEIDKEDDQMVKDLEAQADSLRMSGAWEEMTR